MERAPCSQARAVISPSIDCLYFFGKTEQTYRKTGQFFNKKNNVYLIYYCYLCSGSERVDALQRCNIERIGPAKAQGGHPHIGCSPFLS